MNDTPHDGVNFVFPTLAVEHAVVPDARLDVMGLPVEAKAAAQVLRGHGLTDGADIVFFALDGQQCGLADRARIDFASKQGHFTARQGMLLKNRDRKSTRLNSSHLGISYAVF